MTSAWSQAEEAFRDTLVHKAEGYWFSKIADLHGFSRPKSIAEAAWRGALIEVAYGPRDTFPVVFKALSKALAAYIEVFDDCSYVVGNAISRAAGWHEAYINRYIRIGDTIYFSTNVDGTELELSPYATSYWSAASFGSTDAIDKVEVLPFMVWERAPGPPYGGSEEEEFYHGSTNTVEVEVWPHLAFVPETWLQSPTEYLTASQGTCPVDGGDVCTPDDMPNGGYLLDTDVDDLEEDWEVAYPVYLADDTAAPELANQFDRLLPAGNHIDMYATYRHIAL